MRVFGLYQVRAAGIAQAASQADSKRCHLVAMPAPPGRIDPWQRQGRQAPRLPDPASPCAASLFEYVTLRMDSTTRNSVNGGFFLLTIHFNTPKPAAENCRQFAFAARASRFRQCALSNRTKNVRLFLRTPFTCLQSVVNLCLQSVVKPDWRAKK